MDEPSTLEGILMTLLGGAGGGTAGVFGFKKFRKNGDGPSDGAVLARINNLETMVARIDTRVDDLGDAVERQNAGVIARAERMLAKQDSVEAKLSHLEGFTEAKMR